MIEGTDYERKTVEVVLTVSNPLSNCVNYDNFLMILRFG